MLDRATLGERLQAALELRDLTQGQLAHKARVRQGSISMIISGARKAPRVDTLAALAVALDVSLDWLMGLPRRDKEVLQPDEDALLHLYRQIASPTVRRTVLDIVRGQLAVDRELRRER